MRVRDRRGQSIIEYLVVAAAIIAALVLIGPTVQSKTKGLGDEAGNRIDAAKGTITTNVTAVKR